eukprot:scaffold7808_cov184-Amphora_coffeaeformis.AAC.30
MNEWIGTYTAPCSIVKFHQVQKSLDDDDGVVEGERQIWRDIQQGKLVSAAISPHGWLALDFKLF